MMNDLRFLYLIQGDCSRPMYTIPQGSDFLYLQWQADFQAQPHHVHFPDSSWAEGRNALAQRAKERGAYDYYVFLDDDLQLGFVNRWRGLQEIRASKQKWQYTWPSLWYGQWTFDRFEHWIRRTHPVIAVPSTLHHGWYGNVTHRAVDGVTYFDHMCMAIHTSAVDNLLPYSTEHDAKNWWFCGEEFCRQASQFYPGKIHRYNRLLAKNTAARRYPRQTKGWTLPDNELTAVDTRPFTSVASLA